MNEPRMSMTARTQSMVIGGGVAARRTPSLVEHVRARQEKQAERVRLRYDRGR